MVWSYEEGILSEKLQEEKKKNVKWKESRYH
jgi:hypothetical protein